MRVMGCGLWVVATLAGPLVGQDMRVIALAPEDAAAMREIYARKAEADREWRAAVESVRVKYTTTPGVATAGNVSIPVRNPLPGWAWGIRFSQDLAVIVAKPAPKEKKEESADAEAPALRDCAIADSAREACEP